MNSKGVRKYRDSQSYESQVKREQIHKQASGYLKPAQRVGCHSCQHAKPETANSRLRCMKHKPHFVVNKLGWCPKHERIVQK